MASAARNQQIREAYNVRSGSKLETFKQVNEGARFEGIGPKDKNRITMAEVRKWYLENNIGALKIQTGFNSYVAPTTDHELQVDLFEYKFKQPERPKMNHTLIDGKEYDVGRAMARSLAKVDPYGIIAINPFTKKVHVESVLGKSGRDDWKPALQKIIDKMGKPKSIYTDPDASVLGHEVRAWCKQKRHRERDHEAARSSSRESDKDHKEEARRQIRVRRPIRRRRTRELLDEARTGSSGLVQQGQRASNNQHETGRSGETRKRTRRKNQPRDKRHPSPKVSSHRGGGRGPDLQKEEIWRQGADGKFS